MKIHQNPGAPTTFELTILADQRELQRLEAALSLWRSTGEPCSALDPCAACHLLAEVRKILNP